MSKYTDPAHRFEPAIPSTPIAHEPECVYAGKPHYAHMTSCVACDNIRAQKEQPPTEEPHELTTTDIVNLLTLAIDAIDELSEQQAMPDPWYKGVVAQLTTARNALNANT